MLIHEGELPAPMTTRATTDGRRVDGAGGEYRLEAWLGVSMVGW